MPFKFNPLYGTLDLVESGGSGSGNVTGIPPTTIGAIAQWADTVGETIADSPGTFVQPGGSLQTNGFIGNRSVTTTISIPSEYYMVAAELELEVTGSIQLEPNAELIIV
jgi:hypothetical protein